jgi:hypothetical protein
MEIVLVADGNRRFCSICSRRIKKGQIMVRHPEVINEWNDIRMWFGHLDCVVRRLTEVRGYMQRRLAEVPKISINLKRKEIK